MGLLDFFKKKPAKQGYADSSSIPPNERQYYQPDEYYTFSSYPGTMMERPVVTFEERMRTCAPSRRGLYVAEILLLYYCSKGEYPNPKKGYPSLWWFEYGIRDVGGALRSLEQRGFITLDGNTGKYGLTDLGKAELSDNEYVPYMHKTKRKTIEGDKFGKEYNVWSINRLLADNPDKSWNDIIEQEENAIKKQLSSTKEGATVDANLSGEELERAGRVDEAIALYEKCVSERFDGSYPYNRLAIIYRKRKDYDNEIRVLEQAIDIYSHDISGDNTKLSKFQERLEKAKELKRRKDGESQ